VNDLGGGYGGLDGNVPAGTTDYLYSGSRCIEERDGLDTVLRQYVWGHYVDELMQLRELTGEKAGDYYPLTDLLHRAVALTDGAAKIVEAYDTDAYGWTLVFTGPGADGRWFTDDDVRTRLIGGEDLPAAPMCRYLFTGREYDAESRLYYCRGRYYDPELGRFISRDPIDYGGGMNLYEYCGGGPTGAVDPMGTVDTQTALNDPGLQALVRLAMTHYPGPAYGQENQMTIKRFGLWDLEGEWGSRFQPTLRFVNSDSWKPALVTACSA